MTAGTNTSLTYAFAPSASQLVQLAFDRIQIRPASLTQDHMVNARLESNFLQLAWQNLGVSLWTVDLQETALVQGTATYDVDPTTVMILDAYIRTGTTPNFIDRFISPISRTDYAAQANKAQQGFTTSFWFDRLIEPTITLWPVPDGNGPYTLRYYRYRMLQDAEYTNGLQPEIPALFLDAWVSGLSARLARIYAPELQQIRDQDASNAWALAAQQNTENVSLYISPMISSYYRI